VRGRWCSAVAVAPRLLAIGWGVAYFRDPTGPEHTRSEREDTPVSGQVQQDAASRMAVRVGSGCAVIGALTFAAFRLSHGDLPADDPRGALQFIAEHSFYAGVHLGAIVGAVLLVCAVVAFAHAYPVGPARVLSKLAAASAVAGLGVFGFEHSADGVAGEGLAAAWAADGADQAAVELAATTAFEILRGPSLVALILMFGVPMLLLAGPLLRQRYPAWLAWAGAVLATVLVIGGLVLLLDRDLFPGAIVYGLVASVLVPLWSATLGVIMWLRSNPEPEH
jgi:hypothetical protein